MEKKKHKSWQYLLLIPIQIVIDIFILWLSVRLDVMLFQNSGETLGHAVPAISLIAFFVFGFITILVFILSIVFAIRGARKNKALAQSEFE